VDSIEGITHALRSNEYHSSEEQYYWFIENVPGLNKVYIKDFGRVNFTYTLLSKRKLNHFVKNNLVGSWEDPRFPTIQGVRRRGMRVEALRGFILSDSKRTVCMDIHELWAKNRQLIDPIIPRYFAVRRENIVTLELDGPPSAQKVDVFKHRKTKELGTKQITRCKKIYIEQEDAKDLSIKEEITLMDWGNVIITEINKNQDELVISVKAVLHPSGNVKQTDKKLTWLPDDPSVPLVDILLIEYDTLINVPRIPKEDKEWTKFINDPTKFETSAYADPNVRSLKRLDQFQFERIGYFVLDSDPNDPILHFVQTPDGHTKNKFLSKKVAERH
jgi:glutamyl-tRNA synthetase